LVILTVATIIALPIGLPLAIDAVDAQFETTVWDVAWPLLFLLLPLVLGVGFRVWWSDLTAPSARWVVRVAILCLLFNLNFTLVAYWTLFVNTWGTESYIAALAGPRERHTGTVQGDTRTVSLVAECWGRRCGSGSS
jgi:BASS family bile acid:Na+ symporter